MKQEKKNFGISNIIQIKLRIKGRKGKREKCHYSSINNI